MDRKIRESCISELISVVADTNGMGFSFILQPFWPIGDVSICFLGHVCFLGHRFSTLLFHGFMQNVNEDFSRIRRFDMCDTKGPEMSKPGLC